MKTESWRQYARPIIATTLIEQAGKSEKEIRKALREAYPFGMRKYWPYKVWCDEVNRQMKKPTALKGAEKQLELFN